MMERAYRPPSRRRLDGTRFDFSLQFHASRVPSSGWDKLVVSVISFETGKITVKTPRGHVRNGTCQWPEPVIESTKLTQDPSTGAYDEKLYKLLVQMGSLRVGILGEAVIDLSDYVNSSSPDSVALPLKNCSVGTVLHVKVQCLTPKTSSRELDRRRSANLEQEEIGSEEEGSSLENQTRNVGASANIVSSARSYLTNLQGQAKTRRSTSPTKIQRDGPPSRAASRHSSDSSDSLSYGNDLSDSMTRDLDAVPTLRRPDSTSSRDSGNGKDSGRSSFAPGTKQPNGAAYTAKGQSDSYNWQNERVNSNLANGSRTSSGLSQKLEAAEATIQELRGETLTWERQARKLSVEVETLKQQLVAEQKNVAELKIEMSAVEAERDGLRLEAEQLKLSKLGSRRWDDENDDIRWELEESRRLIKTLQEEANFQKELTADLQMQLRKTQDSNSELVFAVTELEENLDSKISEVESVVDMNRKLKEQLNELQHSNAELAHMVTELEEQLLADREMGCPTTNSGQGHIQLDMDEAEIFRKEAEWEQKFKAAQSEFLQKLAEKEEKLEAMEAELRQATLVDNHFNADDAEWMEELSSAERESTRKITEKDGTVEERTIKLNNLEDRKVNELITETSDKDLLKTVDALRRRMEEQEVDCKELTDENMELFHKLSTASKELDSKRALISDLEKRLEEMSMHDGGGSSDKKQSLINEQEFKQKYQQKLMHLEEENAEFREQLKQVRASKGNLEAMIAELQKQKEELELQLQYSSENFEADDKRHDAQISELYQDLEKHKASEKSLQLDLAERCGEIDRLIQEVADHVASEKSLEAQLREVENARLLLDAKLQELSEERGLNKSRIEELEYQLPILSEEIKLLNASKNEYHAMVLKLETEKADIQETLDEAQDESRGSRDRLEELVGQMTALTTTLDSQLVAKRTLERRAAELERDKEELETQIVDLEEMNVQLSERISGLEAQLRYITEERESYKLEMETARALSLDHQAEISKLEARLQDTMSKHQIQLTELEKQHTFASQEAENNAKVRQNLQHDLEKTKSEYSNLEHSYSELQKLVADLERHQTFCEQQLQNASNECGSLRAKCSMLEADIVERQKEVEQKDLAFKAKMETLVSINENLEHRTKKAEEALVQLQEEKIAAVDLLQSELQRITEQLSSTSDEKENLASQALVEASELRAEKMELEENLKHMQEKVREMDEELSHLQKRLELKNVEMTRELDASKSMQVHLSQKVEEMHSIIEQLTATGEEDKSKLQELERLLSNSENERMRVMDEKTILSNQALELTSVKKELKSVKDEMEQISLDKSALELLLKEKTAQCANLQQEKITIEERLRAVEVIVLEVDELKRQKAALEDKLVRFQSLLEAQEAAKVQEAEQRNELIRLKRQMSQAQRKLVEQEEEKIELQRRITFLEEELSQKADTLSRTEKQLKALEASGGGKKSMDRSNSKLAFSSPSRDSKEILELRERLRFLEEDGRAKEEEFDNIKREYLEKEAELLRKIEYLELTNEQLITGLADSGADQLKNELLRLQNQNSFLSRREQELLSSMQTEEVLQSEVRRLEEANDLLEARLSKFMETAKNPFLLEKIVSLETELAEAVEANNMYKIQLRNVLDKQQNVSMAALQDLGDLNQVINDLKLYKKKAMELEDELHSTNQRLMLISIQLAEAEAEKSNLFLELKSLKSDKKT